ncbi:MAG: hypothetical protein ABS909_04430, partial [Arthrobacter sp.]
MTRTIDPLLGGLESGSPAAASESSEAIMGTGPNDPMYGYNGPGYPPPPGLMQSNKGWGMALAGLILGIVALFLFWIPIISWLALVLALVGLGLGIAALV